MVGQLQRILWTSEISEDFSFGRISYIAQSLRFGLLARVKLLYLYLLLFLTYNILRPPCGRRHFEIHFLQRFFFLYFDTNFTEICYQVTKVPIYNTRSRLTPVWGPHLLGGPNLLGDTHRPEPGTVSQISPTFTDILMASF